MGAVKWTFQGEKIYRSGWLEKLKEICFISVT